jgi:hypothetical protein
MHNGASAPPCVETELATHHETVLPHSQKNLYFSRNPAAPRPWQKLESVKTGNSSNSLMIASAGSFSELARPDTHMNSNAPLRVNGNFSLPVPGSTCMISPVLKTLGSFVLLHNASR